MCVDNLHPYIYKCMFAHIYLVNLFVCLLVVFFFFLGSGLYILPLYLARECMQLISVNGGRNGMYLHGQSFQLLVQDYSCGDHNSTC